MTDALPVMRILPEAAAGEWDALISRLPGAHFLQTQEWAQVKAPIGWKPLLAAWESGGEAQAAALILVRSIRIGGFELPVRVMYAPRGPLLDWSNQPLRRQVITDLQNFTRRQGAVFLKMDPEVTLGSGVPGTENDYEDITGTSLKSELSQSGWRFSSDQIQFRNTVIVDLTCPEEDLLGRMKQKTRYNIRLAEKKGVQVSLAGPDDLHTLYQMYAETSLRDGFVIRGEDYYRRVWSLFMQAGMAQPLIARVEGEAVAGMVIFHFGGRAWYVYGMSREVHRDRMPNYLLQWEAMRRAKSAGCLEYDLWGAPEIFDENDSMWGVYRFKEGLGGRVRRTLGAWDYAPRQGLYQLYTQSLPRILDFMRRRGKKRTAQEVTSL